MMDAFVPMAIFALATSITPGPVNVLSAMTGAHFGVWNSLAYVLGATSSFVIILLMLGAGLQSVMVVVERHSALLAVIGGAYMLWLAWQIARDGGTLSIGEGSQPGACPEPVHHRDRPGVMAGLLTQGTNPKAWIVALSAVSIYVSPHPEPGLRLAVFSLIFFVVCFLSLLAWVILGAQLTRFHGNVAWFNRIMALLLAVSVLVMLTDVIGGNHGSLLP